MAYDNKLCGMGFAVPLNWATVEPALRRRQDYERKIDIGG